LLKRTLHINQIWGKKKNYSAYLKTLNHEKNPDFTRKWKESLLAREKRLKRNVPAKKPLRAGESKGFGGREGAFK